MLNLIEIVPVSKYNSSMAVLLCANNNFLSNSSSTDSSLEISLFVKLYQLSELDIRDDRTSEFLSKTPA